MYIFLISQVENDDYDTYDAAVVIAPNEDWARTMHPAGSNRYPDFDPWIENVRTWASSPENVKVERIGEYFPTPDEQEDIDGLQPRFILKSFNAG